MRQEILEAVREIEEDERELAERKALILSLKEDDVPDEDKWHEICETPLRYSKLLATFVRNMFPEAEDVSVSANCVRFTLKGFGIELPTSRIRGINADLSWYEKDRGEPKFYPEPETKRMMEFFKARDAKEGWKKQAKILIGTRYRDWFLFVLWFGKYCRRLPDRKFWEEKFEKELEAHGKRVAKYYEKRREIREKTEKFFKEVLPALDAFSPYHYGYGNAGAFSPTIEDIRKAEFPETESEKP